MNTAHPNITELQQRWIDNLRSGRFEQGKHKLCSEDGRYCCLGVACETLREIGFPIQTETLLTGTKTYDRELVLAPAIVVEAMQLHSDRGGVAPDKEQLTLTVLNDDGDKTFEQIAERLETGVYFKNCAPPAVAPKPEPPAEPPVAYAAGQVDAPLAAA